MKHYYYYDHVNGEGHKLGHFGHFMEFIDKSYDFDIHSVHDCLASHKMCCEENDNPIEEDYNE
jgi:hypothetical protein